MGYTAIQSLLYAALGIYVLLAWLRERKDRKLHNSAEAFWPGTTYAPACAYYLAAAGAILITLAETSIELFAGFSSEQSSIPAILILQLLGASVVEETLFRGFFVPRSCLGRRLIVIVVLGSLVFALIHNFDLSTPKGQCSAAFAFIISIWLYGMRFISLNPEHSLLPCIVGHAVRNIAVFGIKWAQGFIN